MHLEILFSQILNVSNLTSEKKVCPQPQTASAVEAKVKRTITASPDFNPSAIKPKRRASVPLEQHNTYLDFENMESLFSKSLISGP